MPPKRRTIPTQAATQPSPEPEETSQQSGRDHSSEGGNDPDQVGPRSQSRNGSNDGDNPEDTPGPPGQGSDGPGYQLALFPAGTVLPDGTTIQRELLLRTNLDGSISDRPFDVGINVYNLPSTVYPHVGHAIPNPSDEHGTGSSNLHPSYTGRTTHSGSNTGGTNPGQPRENASEDSDTSSARNRREEVRRGKQPELRSPVNITSLPSGSNQGQSSYPRGSNQTRFIPADDAAVSRQSILTALKTVPYGQVRNVDWWTALNDQVQPAVEDQAEELLVDAALESMRLLKEGDEQGFREAISDVICQKQAIDNNQ